MRLTMQETRVRSLIREDLTCHGATQLLFSKAKQGSPEDQTLHIQYLENCFQKVSKQKLMQPCTAALLVKATNFQISGSLPQINVQGNCSVQFSHLVMSDSSRPHGPQYTRLPCPSPTPGVYSNSSPLSRWDTSKLRGSKCYPKMHLFSMRII